MTAEPVIGNDFIRLKHCRYGPMLYVVNDRYIGQSLDRYGEFSEGEMELLKQIVRPGQVAVDVGANVGTHAVVLAQTVGPAGAVHAFEPQRVVFQVLCGNVALNGLTNVFTYQSAVGLRPGSIRVPPLDYHRLANFGGLSLAADALYGEAVPLVTVDQLELSACHLIKVDVEGMESDVLAGAEGTIHRCRPNLYVENDREEKSPALVEKLLAMDYRLYWHLPPLFNPRNFFAETENLFPGIISANMLGIHASVSQNIAGLREIRSPGDRWQG